MKTRFQTKEEALADRKWLLVDAENQVIGRLAAKVAGLLRGKHKATYCPHNDGGDFVVVINADKAVFTGGKADKEFYYRHTGFIGGIRKQKKADLMAEKPEELVHRVVKGMLPKTSLGRDQLRKLKVYGGTEHPHTAQQPQVIS